MAQWIARQTSNLKVVNLVSPIGFESHRDRSFCKKEKEREEDQSLR